MGLLNLKSPLGKLTTAAALVAGMMPPPAVAQNDVTITDRGTHYDVVLNLENGATHRQVGEQYGRLLREKVPDFEKQLDSYIAENCTSWIIHKAVMRRVRLIKPQIPQEYRDEIEGIASQLSGGDDDERGDGKISENELYLFNLLGDVARLYQCCAVGVYGDSSATGSPIVGRNFDWPDGKQNQLAKIQSVLTIKDGRRSTVTVGCLGFQGAVSSFNRNGVFAAILDSPTGGKYSPIRKRSYLLDLRQALENCQTLDGVADWMKEPSRRYAVNHLIILADKQKVAVLENNVSNRTTGAERGEGVRTLRTADSQLRDGVTWGIPNAIGCVNCFQLPVSEDNTVDPWDEKEFRKQKKDQGRVTKPMRQANIYRWQSLKNQLALQTVAGRKVTRDGIKQTLSYYSPQSRGDMYKGDLYNWFTIQSIVFEPADLSLEVAFRPRKGGMPPRPNFEHIQMHIKPASLEQLSGTPGTPGTSGTPKSD